MVEYNEKEVLTNVKKQLALPEKVELIWFKTAVKRQGRPERNYWYRIEGTNDVVLIQFGPNMGTMCAEIKENYFIECKEFGEKCKEVADELGLPITVVLAVGYENASKLPKNIMIEDTKKSHHELTECGIQRRKDEILRLLGRDLYEKFKVDEMGQLNSKRLASYLDSTLEVCSPKKGVKIVI